MKNKSLIIIIIQAIIIVTLVWMVIIVGGDKLFKDFSDDDDETIVDYTSSLNELTYVQLPASVERNSGITFQPIEISSEVSDIYSYGEVLNLSDLFAKKNNLANLSRKKNKINNQLIGELEYLEKLKALNGDNKNIADNVLAEKEGEVDFLENDLAIVENDITNILINTEHKWGAYFKKHIVLDQNTIARSIFSNKYRLINITIPSEDLPLQMPAEVNVFLPNNNTKYKAEFISEAPSSNKSLQGRSFFYVIKNNEINLGSKIKANITKSNKQSVKKKLFIPSKSVVWNNGKPWVFIKTDVNNGNFLRRPLLNPLETDNGWVINEDILKINDLVVVDGAQLLLSEEFKYQIKNENED